MARGLNRQSAGTIGFIGMAFLVPALACADLQSEGADILACSVDDSTTLVCASEGLSNVVVQCIDEETKTIYYRTYDDLGELANWPKGEESAYAGEFSCPGGDSLIAVYVDSGRHQIDDDLEGLPPESSAMWSPTSCLLQEATCPALGEEEEMEEAE
jgi:hypothetical protein